MKVGALILALIFAFAVYVMLHPPRGGSFSLPGLSSLASLAQSSDPVAQMESMRDHFPKNVQYGNERDVFFGIAFDVQKTDSIVNPVLGFLYFTNKQTSINGGDDAPDYTDLRAVYQWRNGRWYFHMLENAKEHSDITYTSGGLALAKVPELSHYFGPDGWVEPSNTAIAEPPAATPKPQQEVLREQFAAQEARVQAEQQAAAAARTPTPQEVAAQQAARARTQASDIARKYSGH